MAISDPPGGGPKIAILGALRCRVRGGWGGSAHYPDPTAQSVVMFAERVPPPRALPGPGTGGGAAGGAVLGAGLPLSPSSGWPPSEPVEAASRWPSWWPSWCHGSGSTCAIQSLSSAQGTGSGPNGPPLGFRWFGFASSGGSSPPSTPVRSLPKPPPRCRLPMSASAATPKTLLGGDDGRLASRHPIAACVAHVAQRRIWAVIRLGSPPPDHPPIYTRARVRGWPGDVL